MERVFPLPQSKAPLLILCKNAMVRCSLPLAESGSVARQDMLYMMESAARRHMLYILAVRTTRLSIIPLHTNLPQPELALSSKHDTRAQYIRETFHAHYVRDIRLVQNHVQDLIRNLIMAG